MWYLNKIPTTAHFYWGGNKLSYLRYMTIDSFRILNPDWKIKIHTPKIVGSIEETWETNEQKGSDIQVDYFDQLSNLNVEIIQHDFEEYGFTNNAHEVHKSDFIRWYLLGTEGGLWSDFDILYYRPMDELLENKQDNRNATASICYYTDPYWVSIGFILSSSNNEFYQHIHKLSKDNFDKKQYQSIGCKLFENEYTTPFELTNSNFKLLTLKPISVYPLDAFNVRYYYRPIKKKVLTLLNNKEVIGFHWFGGHKDSRDLENNLTPNNLLDYDNILSLIIQRLNTYRR